MTSAAAASGSPAVEPGKLPVHRGMKKRTNRAAQAFQRLRGRRVRLLLPQVALFFSAMLLLHVVYNYEQYMPVALGGTPAATAASMQLGEGAGSARQLQSDFPRDVLLDGVDPNYTDASNKGWLFLHAIGVIYMFVGLAIVCDDYFVSALEEMCDRWQISEDVAGATFMAAGGSAPELFTSLLGVFVAESDVGFGTIVGSAVFNVLFVIALCAIFAKEVLELTWWPLARDCTYYSFGLLVLIACVYDNVVEWYESAILLCCYLVYVLIMKYNVQLKAKVSRCCRCKTVPADPDNLDDIATEPKTMKNTVSFVHHHALEAQNEAVRFRDFRSSTCHAIIYGQMVRLQRWLWAAGGGTRVERKRTDAWKSSRRILLVKAASERNGNELPVTPEEATAEAGAAGVGAGAGAGEDEAVAIVGSTNQLGVGPPGDAEAVSGLVEEEILEAEANEGVFDLPDNTTGKILWALTLPLRFLMWATIPDCRKEKYAKFFVVTFLMSLVWIAAFSYGMVWWASVIGFALGIPEAVMGLTVLAGGTSIPDAISSVIVARNGFGDMAVSSSIGSNIFDINVGLPLPWLLSQLIFGKAIPIASCGLPILSASLLCMVLFVVLSIKCLGWKLDRKLGGIMFILYILFVTESLLLEYDVIKLDC